MRVDGVGRRALTNGVLAALPLMVILSTEAASGHAHASSPSDVAYAEMGAAPREFDRSEARQMERTHVTARRFDPWSLIHSMSEYEAQVLGGLGRYDTTTYEESPGAEFNLDDNRPDPCASSSVPMTTANPVDLQSGNKIRQEVDIIAEGEMALGFTRYYSAGGAIRNHHGWFGFGWSSNLEMRITEGGTPAASAVEHPALAGSSPASTPDTLAAVAELYVTMELGRTYRYERVSGSNPVRWQVPGDSFSWIERSGANYLLKRADDSWIRFRSNGMVDQVGNRFGQTWDYAYTSPGPNQFVTVTRSGGQSLKLRFSGGRVASVEDAEGEIFRYSYGTGGKLETVDYPGPNADSRTYHYESQISGLLTGISLDGRRYQSYSYHDEDPEDFLRYARVKETVLEGGAQRLQFDYDQVYDQQGFRYRTFVTNAKGLTTTYTYKSIPSSSRGGSDTKLVAVDRNAFAGCGASAAQYAYDENGFLDFEVDFNGVKTDYLFNLNGQLIERVDGVVASDSPNGLRKTEYEWDTKNRLASRKVSEADADGAGAMTQVYEESWIYAFSTSPSQKSARNRLSRYRYTSLSGENRSRDTTYEYTLRADGSVSQMVVDGPAARTQGGGVADGQIDRVIFEFDQAGLLTSEENNLGHRIELTRNARGQVESVLDANQVTKGFEYDGRGRVRRERVAAPSGLDIVRDLSYDRFGNVVRVQQVGQPTKVREYDRAGRLIWEGIEYDLPQPGWIRSEGRSTTYDLLSKPVSMEFNRYTFMPDQCTPVGGGLMQCINGGFVECRRESFSFFVHDQAGRLTEVLEGRASESAVKADPQKTSCFAWPGEANTTLRTVIKRDAGGRVTAVTEPGSRTTRYSYDGLGRIRSTQLPGGGATSVSYRFGGVSPKSREVVFVPPNGTSLATTERTNGFGEVTYRKSPDSGMWTYQYANALLVRATRPDARSITYEYDALGRPEVVTYPELYPNDLGQVGTVKMEFAYDSCEFGVGRVCHVDDGVQSIRRSYSYTPLGQVARAGDADKRIVGSTVELVNSLSVQYGFDSLGRMNLMTYPNGINVAYDYGDDGRIQSVKARVGGTWRTLAGGDTESSAIEYAPDGGILKYAQGTAATQDYLRDSFSGRLQGSNFGSVQRLSYNYGSDGLVSGIVDDVDATRTYTTYGYDGSGRLASASSPRHSEQWTYSSSGNRTHHRASKRSGGTQSQIPDVQVAYAYGPGSRANMLTSLAWQQGGSVMRSYTHDSMGNRSLQSDTGSAGQSNELGGGSAPSSQPLEIEFFYDAMQRQGYVRRLKDGFRCDPEIDQAACRFVSKGVWGYGYNYAGLRVFKFWNTSALGQQDDGGGGTHGGERGKFEIIGVPGRRPPAPNANELNAETVHVWFQRFLYAPTGELLAETAQINDDNPPVRDIFVYLHGKPIAMIRNGSQVYNIHTDHLGRPQTLTQNGTVRWQAFNSPFHRKVTASAIGAMNLGFPGQYYDDESNLYYNWHRYYDPSTGRYTQSDPIGLAGGLNTYAYVGGNPLLSIDPFGLYETSFVVGGAVAGVLMVPPVFGNLPPIGFEVSLSVSVSRSGWALTGSGTTFKEGFGAFVGATVIVGGAYGQEICDGWSYPKGEAFSVSAGKGLVGGLGYTVTDAGIGATGGVGKFGFGYGAFGAAGSTESVSRGWEWW